MNGKNCYVNVNKMLRRRGYLFQETVVSDNEKMYLFFIKIQVILYYYVFLRSPKIGIEIFKYYLNKTLNPDITKYTMIYQENITQSCVKIVKNMKLQYDIELFQLNELQSDIMESPYYLPHILLSKTEKEELKKIYQGKLPSIPLSDPIIRYFAFRKQDVIKIIRDPLKEVYYRVVK